ncbi:MAG TPA: ATP-binding cassette domain-containing protein [Acidimicrobiales bacterium]|nr:ATP-binding cassette domain-containing protein [Acidimicrobiales bacterium]
MTTTSWPRFALAAVIAVALPGLAGSLGLLTNFRALVVGTAVCMAVAALSLNIVLGYTGLLSLGHIALMGFGAFVGAKLTSPDELRLAFGPALLLAALGTGVVGFLVGLPALRLRGIYLAIVTLAFQYVMWQSLFRSEPLSAGSGGVSFPRPWFGTRELASNTSYLVVVLLVAVVVWLVDTNLTESKLGRALQAIRADEAVAASFGIDVVRMKLLAFSLSGAMAGVAGFLYGHLNRFVAADSFPLLQSLLLVIMVVVGGIGSRTGIAVAAAFFGVFPLVLEGAIGQAAATNWGAVIGAAGLLVAVAHNPEGLAGAVRELREKRAERSAIRLQAEAAAGAEPGVDTTADLSFPLPPAGVGRATGEVVLEATDIRVRFGGLVAVDGASITVPRGKIVGLIGPNGAGKTTMFNAISGAVTAERGRVVLLGEDVTRLAAHRRVQRGLGRTFQLVGLARDRSVTENLLLAQHQLAGYSVAEALTGLNRAPRVEAELRARAAEALAGLGFERFADLPVRKLSGGQQRIVEIACALVTAPELLMLDEPSAGLAPAAVERLGERLIELQERSGATILLIEHNIPLVLATCDELTVMAEGQVIASGAPREVVAVDEVVDAYLGRVPA